MLNWVITSYNPYFDCFPCYFHWHKDSVVLIYSEKHNIYGVVATREGIKATVLLGSLGSEICVYEDTVYVRRVEKNNKQIERYLLPHFSPISDLSLVQGVVLGILVRISS